MTEQQQITLRIEGMTCDSCADPMARALKGVPDPVEMNDEREMYVST